MDSCEERIRDFISRHQIQAQHLKFDRSCHSVEEAAAAAEASTEDFVKNICLMDADENLIVAIVKGEDRVSRKKVSKELKIPMPRLATPEEILNKTGYPCGGTPSFGFDALFLIDVNVMKAHTIYTGGGSETSLIRTSPGELLRANDGTIAYIHK